MVMIGSLRKDYGKENHMERTDNKLSEIKEMCFERIANPSLPPSVEIEAMKAYALLCIAEEFNKENYKEMKEE